MKVDGGCHCGAITYQAEIDPDKVGICHCTDCQALSGSAFRTIAPTVPGGFTLLSGEPRIYVKIGDSGAERPQAFCGGCGAPIYATSMGDGPKVYNLRVGTIRQRDRLMPRSQVWARSSQPWLDNLPAVAQFNKSAS